MSTAYFCEFVPSSHQIPKATEIHTVYGPAYYTIQSSQPTDKLVAIGEKVKQVFELAPLSPDCELQFQMSDEDEFPKKTKRLVFWVRDPKQPPKLSKNCDKVSIREVLTNPKKQNCLSLLNKATFLLDK